MTDPHELPPPESAKEHGSAESSVLVIEGRDGARLVVPLSGEEIILGRAAQGSTVRLPERDVSRRHARFTCSNGAVWIEDLGSSNGTRVNGERIQTKRRLREGDLVQLGGYDVAVLGASLLPPGLEHAVPVQVKDTRSPVTASPVQAPQPQAPPPGPSLPKPAPDAVVDRPPGIGVLRVDSSTAPESPGPSIAATTSRSTSQRRTMMLIAAGLISLLVGWTAGRFLRLLERPPVSAVQNAPR